MLRNIGGTWQRALAAALLALSTTLAIFGTNVVQAKAPQAFVPANSVALAELPREGRDMMALIVQGGPFRYDRDGTVFGNRERILPAQARGYYREYTVRTPNDRSRGARRIVCGGAKPAAPDACYYTDDHYASFRQIVQPAGR